MPPIFLIENLLSEDEADELKSLAGTETEGLRFWHRSDVLASKAVADRNMSSEGAAEMLRLMTESLKDSGENQVSRLLTFMKDMMAIKTRILTREAFAEGGEEGLAKKLSEFDANKDGFLELEELRTFAGDHFSIPNIDDEAFAAIYAHISQPQSVAETASLLNSTHIPVIDAARANVATYLSKLQEDEPHRMTRWSDQTWLKKDLPAVQRLLNRAQAISGLPKAVIDTSEDLQIVRYKAKGHYACHRDSSVDEKTGIRYATLGVILESPIKGGETAFPGASTGDGKTWTVSEWVQLEKDCERTPACATLGGIVVPPKKGTGIFWYNVNPAKPRGRHLILESLHCAAEVIEGEKWFANLWLRAEQFWPTPPSSHDEL